MGDTSSSRSAGLVGLVDEQCVAELLGESVIGLWEVVNTLTRLRPTRRAQWIAAR